jgi:hypothetical protein
LQKKENGMTEKGFIICRPESETILNGLEYLLDEKNEIRYFDSEEKVNYYLEEWDLSDNENIRVKYHIFCRHCAKEFFFDTTEIPEDTDFFLCPDYLKDYE